MSVIGPITLIILFFGPGPVPLSWGSPVSKRNLQCEGFVEKVGFEPGVKEWRSDGWREWRWWQRWVDKWMRRWVETRMVRLTEWIWKFIPLTRWCTSKWAICDFQGGEVGGQERVTTDEERVYCEEVEERWGCEDGYVEQLYKNFVGEREKFIFDAFVDL